MLLFLGTLYQLACIDFQNEVRKERPLLKKKKKKIENPNKLLWTLRKWQIEIHSGCRSWNEDSLQKLHNKQKKVVKRVQKACERPCKKSTH